MKRLDRFNSIEEMLNALAYRIEVRGGLNLLDLHLHSEDFFLHFLNMLFDWKLRNLNTARNNAPALDLADDVDKIVVQVSATATKRKVESALAKADPAYGGYAFKFVAISKNASGLRSTTYRNPNGLRFSPREDILDIPSLLAIIRGLDTDRQEEIHSFLQKELRDEPDPRKTESNLAAIIDLLSKEDWNSESGAFETRSFNPEEKITYNRLDLARPLIEDYKIHCHRIAAIYAEFDKQGTNKSLSVLNGVRTIYLGLEKGLNPDRRFFSVVDALLRKIQASANYKPVPDEELELCVQILVVDAFIRCKIFANPSGDRHACA